MIVKFEPTQSLVFNSSSQSARVNYEEWNVLTTKRLLQCSCGYYESGMSLPFVSPLDVTPLFTCDLSSTCSSQVPLRHKSYRSGSFPFPTDVTDHQCSENYISFIDPQGITGGFTGTLNVPLRATPTNSDSLTLNCGQIGGQYSVTLNLRPRCTWTTVTPYFSATIYFQCCNPAATITSLNPKLSNMIQNGDTYNYEIGSGPKTIQFDYDVSPNQVCKTLDTPNMSWTMDGIDILRTTPPPFLTTNLETNVPFMTIDTSELSLAGSHTFSLTISVSSNNRASHQKRTIEYTVFLKNPCLFAAWYQNSISAMTTSVNVSPTLAPQTFSLSTLNTQINCGPVTYALNETLSFVSLSGLSITVVSTNAADVGIHYLGLVATAGTYTTNKQIMPFTVTINPCQITSFNYSRIKVRGLNRDTTDLTNGGTYDYIIGSEAATLQFQQIESPACDVPAKSVEFSVNEVTSTYLLWPTWIEHKTSSNDWPSYQTQKFVVQSSSAADAGKYLLSVSVTMENGTFSQTVVSTLFINLVNPCLTTTFSTCVQHNIATSVNATPTLSPQSITQCTVASNVDCGLVIYEFYPTKPYITFNSIDKTLTVISNNEEDIGTETFNLIARLDSYRTVTLSMPFTVTIFGCQISSVSGPQVIQNDVNVSLDLNVPVQYIIGSASQNFTFVYFQTPDCQYTRVSTISVNGTVSPTLNWISSSLSLPQQNPTIVIYSTSRTDAGNHSFSVSVQITSGAYFHTIQTQMTFEIIDPCPTTTFNTCTQTNLVTYVGAFPSLTQPITQCSISATIECGTILYALDANQYFLTFDSINKTLTVIITNAANIGVHTVNLIASLDEYPQVTFRMPFTVTINPNCNTTSQQANLDTCNVTMSEPQSCVWTSSKIKSLILIYLDGCSTTAITDFSITFDQSASRTFNEKSITYLDPSKTYTTDGVTLEFAALTNSSISSVGVQSYSFNVSLNGQTQTVRLHVNLIKPEGCRLQDWNFLYPTTGCKSPQTFAVGSNQKVDLVMPVMKDNSSNYLSSQCGPIQYKAVWADKTISNLPTLNQNISTSKWSFTENGLLKTSTQIIVTGSLTNYADVQLSCRFDITPKITCDAFSSNNTIQPTYYQPQQIVVGSGHQTNISLIVNSPTHKIDDNGVNCSSSLTQQLVGSQPPIYSYQTAQVGSPYLQITENGSVSAGQTVLLQIQTFLDAFKSVNVTDTIMLHYVAPNLTQTIQVQTPNTTVLNQSSENNQKDSTKQEQVIESQSAQSPQNFQFEQFLTKNNTKTDNKLQIVNLKVAEITNFGQINISFSEPVWATPDTRYLKDNKFVKAFFIRSNSDKSAQEMGWNLLSFNSTFAQFAVNFTNPIVISQLTDQPDKVVLSFRNALLYSQSWANQQNSRKLTTLSYDYTNITGVLPMQFTSQQEAKTIQGVSSSVGSLATYVFWLIFVGQFLAKSILKYLFDVFLYLQVVLAMPFLAVFVPINCMQMKQQIDAIINMQLIPPGIVQPWFVQNIMKRSYQEYQSSQHKDLILAILVQVILLLLVGIAIATVLLLRWLSQKYKKQIIMRVVKYLENYLMFSAILRVILQMFLQTSISTIQQLVTVQFSTNYSYFSFLVTLATLGFLIIYPFWSYWLVKKQFLFLSSQTCRTRWGNLYIHVDVYNTRAIAWNSIFLGRRLIFAIILVSFSSLRVLQLAFASYIGLAVLAYLIIVKPMEDNANNLIMIISEISLTILTIFGFLFTDYVEDPKKRLKVGWFVIAFTGLTVLINVLIMLTNAVVIMKRIRKIRKEKLLMQDQKQKQIQNKIESEISMKQIDISSSDKKTDNMISVQTTNAEMIDSSNQNVFNYNKRKPIINIFDKSQVNKELLAQNDGEQIVNIFDKPSAEQNIFGPNNGEQIINIFENPQFKNQGKVQNIFGPQNGKQTVNIFQQFSQKTDIENQKKDIKFKQSPLIGQRQPFKNKSPTRLGRDYKNTVDNILDNVDRLYQKNLQQNDELDDGQIRQPKENIFEQLKPQLNNEMQPRENIFEKLQPVAKQEFTPIENIFEKLQVQSQQGFYPKENIFEKLQPVAKQENQPKENILEKLQVKSQEGLYPKENIFEKMQPQMKQEINPKEDISKQLKRQESDQIKQEIVEESKSEKKVHARQSSDDFIW